MRKNLKRKLCSRRGASITFALLLFMVCAVVGSVVLAAGTAASGRVSQLAESDQRYYAVTSAAEYFWNRLNGQTVTVERTYSRTWETTSILNINDGSLVGSSTVISDRNYTTRLNGEATAGADTELLKKAALDLVLGQNAITNSSASWDNDVFGNFGAGIGQIERQFVVFTPASGPDVEVTMTLKSTGNIDLEFQNVIPDGENGEIYKLSFTLTAAHSETASTHEDPGDGGSLTAGEKEVEVTESEIVVDTKSTVITWTAGSISK